jgi:hypothetical protein
LARAGRLLPGEAYAFLVGAPVFKTGEAEDLGLAGSIPVRLRVRAAQTIAGVGCSRAGATGFLLKVCQRRPHVDHARDRVQAVVYANESGLVSPGEEGP